VIDMTSSAAGGAGSGGGVLHVQIDQGKCQGHARCAALAPEIFDTDDLGHGVVRTPDVPPSLAEAAQLAARNCPERAIVLGTSEDRQ
jgi:ferredoxin